ncbi:MAG: hypothetical protein MUP55_01605 [Candidatus Aenigmarchaeota archaeon]|nr:hypothetical protein [Candidatus Aenigmarchaeota archaeon]
MQKYIGKDMKSVVSGRKIDNNYPADFGSTSYKFARGFGETPANEQKRKEENRKGLKHFAEGAAVLVVLGGLAYGIVSDYSSKNIRKTLLGPTSTHVLTLSEAQDPYNNLIVPCAKKMGVKPADVSIDMNENNMELHGEPLLFGDLELGQKVPFYRQCEQK